MTSALWRIVFEPGCPDGGAERARGSYQICGDGEPREPPPHGCGGDDSTEAAAAAKQKQQGRQGGGGGAERRSIFFSHREGIYLTFTAQEIKIKACRTAMQCIIIIAMFLTYYVAWGWCDYCILIAAAGSCGGACAGMGFLVPSCWAGVVASLIRGFRIGNEIAHVDIQWKF